MNNKIINAFSEIHADENLKKRTFENITNKRKIPIAFKLVPVMAALVFAVLGYMYMMPVSYISIDINPSIELSVNTFDRVIAVNASNEDAKEIVDSIDLNNLNYVEALEALAQSEIFSNYSESHTEITVISDSSSEMIEHIEECSFDNGNVYYYSANQELKEEALENDIPFGKYRAYLELIEIDPDINIEEIENLPMKDIREMIENDGVLIEDNSKGNGQGSADGTGGQGSGENAGQGLADGEGQGNNQNNSGNGKGKE